MDKMERLSQTIKDFALGGGAIAVGISTTETLKGGPPSTDLSYVLPAAKSAIVFALPFDQDVLESFLKKEDMGGLNVNNRRINTMASGIAMELSSYLNMKGLVSVPVTANGVYRKDVPGGAYSEVPPLSHRYLAVRSGIGHFGFSGNVITPEYGAAVILGSVVTQAELIPTEPLPVEDNYCDDCNLCLSSCASGLMSKTEKVTVTLGGMKFSYSKRLAYSRCDYVCGGFAGLHSSGKWSTWSPARFPIPEKDEEFLPAVLNAADSYRKRTKEDFGANLYHPLTPGNKLEFTCGHCQFLCHPNKKVRQERYKMITNSGVVIQEANGRSRAVKPEEAIAHLEAMDDETRALYE
ncbi:MAG: epoxyqueuosine reductase [Deltaproteobacteria bacterium]|nr:epoxyqueuosine reductase [Deltaproteobacteria bacterium]